MGNVGGDPRSMTGGASTLHGVGAALRSLEHPLSSAASSMASAAGEPELAAALHRFGAAWSTLVGDTGTQVLASAQLASATAADLTAAGGH